MKASSVASSSSCGKACLSLLPPLSPLQLLPQSDPQSRDAPNNILLGEMTQMKDGRSMNLTRARNVSPKYNKQVTSKQQTRSSLTSIN
jgi:hypothetical protein